MKAWLLFISLYPLSLFAAHDGYTDSLGHYIWLEDRTDSIYLDPGGTQWHRISDDRVLWEEALLIRQANLLALSLLGKDSSQAALDIFLFSQENPLFTKESHLGNPPAYIRDWKKAINSDNWSREARKSAHIRPFGEGSSLVLKYYPQKGKIAGINALGLVRKGFFAHWGEAFLEIFEALAKKVSGNQDPHADPLFDMHLRNAKRLLRKYKKELHKEAPSGL